MANERDRISKLLYYIYLMFLIFAVVVVLNIVRIQLFFTPDPVIAEEVMPQPTRSRIEPQRGEILAHDGRVLAMSFTSYDIFMDCTVRKEYFAGKKEKADSLERDWLSKAKGLSEGLAVLFPEKSAKQYYDEIRNGRSNNRKYLSIARGIDRQQLLNAKQLPLFNEPSNAGGLIVESHNVRKYPYGSLGRRVIGLVRTNSHDETSNNRLGIEGKFDYILHGEEGYEWLRRSDESLVHSNDSSWKKPVDGRDVRTTIDIDIQDLLDRSLKSQIGDNELVEGACGIIMDVKTGAIRAMVNLRRDQSGQLGETYNYAIGRLGEPGSVFKSSTLMTLLEDGYVKSLDETIPTNHGKVAKYPVDDHITQYERESKTDRISILHGLEISSNYVFCYLADKYYSSDPKRFIDKIYMYKLGEAFDFDADGLRTPSVPTPGSASWSGTSLGTTAYGYSITETPLHILTFYNAIANHGKMMKPYLVESFEKNGKVVEKRGESILNASICSRATADTLTRGLVSVTERGTATRLKNAKYKVAGKTGTARIYLEAEETGTGKGGYFDNAGRKKNQGTFVGFFPAEDPKYSILVTVYSKLTLQSFYGGTIPAQTVRQVVDEIATIDPYWMETIKKKKR